MRLFGTDGIRGKANEYPLTVDVCRKLVSALVRYFDLTHGETIVIGKDTRESCDIFEHALAANFASLGVNVQLLGIIPTPAVSIITTKIQFSLGIVISASHNPYYDNGIKIFNKSGLKLKDTEELQIEKYIFEDKVVESNKIGRIIYAEHLIEEYTDNIKNSFSIDGHNKKVVVDSANGAMSAIASDVLRYFHFDVVSINDNPDGKNINENCGVTHSDTIVEAVKNNKADFGIAFDGDGDRVILCDENGDIMDGDQILALFSSLNSESVVSTIMANFGLEKYLTSRDITLIRTNVGDRYISDYMQAHPKTQFGGEPSGHIIIREHALTGDGLFSCLKVLDMYLKSGKNKFSEFSHVFKPIPCLQKNVKIKNKQIMFRSDIDKKIKIYQKQLDGQGRLIVRPSGTEPIIRIMAEGENVEDLQNIVSEIASLLEGTC